MEIIYCTKNDYENAKAFLFGLKGYSTLERLIAIDDISKYNSKDLFLSLDKNMFEDDLKDLEDLLCSLDEYKIAGILFYDLSVLSIAKRLNIKTPLIWNQSFLVTNYKTCQFYENDGVSGAVISPVITASEVIDIAKNTNFDLFVPVFGYQVMGFSRRKLVSNYFKYINESDNSNYHLMIERDKKYPIIESAIGSKIYSDEVLNGIRYINSFKNSGIKYIILTDYMIDSDIFAKVSEYYERAVYNNLKDEELVELEKKVNNLVNGSTLFLDKETVFKVKKV